MMEDILLQKRERQPNPRFPHTCTISRMTATNDPMTDESASTVIYSGECRSYDFHTTTTDGNVIVSNRKLSIPLRQQDYSGSQLLPLEGDLVEVQKCGITEYGYVTDKLPGNLGTHILWRYGRT